MKKDEPYNPAVKSIYPPEGLIFRLVTKADSSSINNLTLERNPFQSLDEVEFNTNREIARVELGDGHKLYVAELNKEVIGFCRFNHSDNLAASKKIYPSPNGFYGLGIMVSPQFRRQNIANFISSKRIEVLKNLGAKELFSIVDTNNLTSMKMHQNFGYTEVARAPGFLHLSFNGGVGCLFKINIL